MVVDQKDLFRRHGSLNDLFESCPAGLRDVKKNQKFRWRYTRYSKLTFYESHARKSCTFLTELQSTEIAVSVEQCATKEGGEAFGVVTRNNP